MKIIYKMDCDTCVYNETPIACILHKHNCIKERETKITEPTLLLTLITGVCLTYIIPIIGLIFLPINNKVWHLSITTPIFLFGLMLYYLYFTTPYTINVCCAKVK